MNKNAILIIGGLLAAYLLLKPKGATAFSPTTAPVPPTQKSSYNPVAMSGLTFAPVGYPPTGYMGDQYQAVMEYRQANPTALQMGASFDDLYDAQMASLSQVTVTGQTAYENQWYGGL